MAIHREKKKKEYVKMAKYHFKDKGMSLKAKGLLSLMLSLPDDWDFSIEGIITLSSDEERSVNKAISELKEAGYLNIRKIPPHKGCNKFSYSWEVFEAPQNEGLQNVGLQNEGLQNEGLQNEGQLINKELTNKELINKELINNNKGGSEGATANYIDSSTTEEVNFPWDDEWS